MLIVKCCFIFTSCAFICCWMNKLFSFIANSLKRRRENIFGFQHSLDLCFLFTPRKIELLASIPIIKIQDFVHQTKTTITLTKKLLVNIHMFLTLQKIINALLQLHLSMAQEKLLIQTVTVDSLSHHL